MIDARTLLLFYRRHLRVQPLREVMAVLGVAAGVALLFAVQIANGSVTGSFERLAKGVAGDATIEVASRSPLGFSEDVYQKVLATRGVKRAGPLLQQQITLAGPKGERALTLVGADERIVALGGSLVAKFWQDAKSFKRGSLVMSDATADAVGARAGELAEVQLGGRVYHLFVSRPVPNNELGAFARSPVAGMPLATAQLLSGLRGQVTRVLVVADPSDPSAVRAALARRLGADVNVRPVSTEAHLLSEAARPQSEVTALFGVVSVVVGGILAFNALQLAGAERRAFVAHLTQLGAPDRLVIASLFFDAVLMGIAGCVLGLAAGFLISLIAYHAVPGYLSSAFPVGNQRVITLSAALVAVAAGMLAALLAAAGPAMRMMRETRQMTGSEPGRTPTRMPPFDAVAFAVGGSLAAGSVLLALLAPDTTVPAIVGFVVGLTLCVPLLVRGILRGIRDVSMRVRDPAARLSAAELQSNPIRSLALAATGVIAVFVLVTVGGAVQNVQTAVRKGASGVVANADIWINPGGRSNVYSTQPFRSTTAQESVARLPGVQGVLGYEQAFLDFAGQRVWAIGVPPGASEPVVASQLVVGSTSAADRRLHEGGWAIVSQTLARKQHLRLGQFFSLPTPSGIARLRLAALISNYGWVQGTVLLSSADYTRYWRTNWASELGVIFKRGVPPAAARQAVAAALPRYSALAVETASERRASISSVLGSTLSRLQEVVTIVLIAALASVVAMMVAGVWQRRGRIDALMSMGMGVGQLARLLFYESGSILLGGCLIGLAAGLLGQELIDRWLRATTGSPVQFAPAWQLGLEALVAAAAIASVATMVAVVRTVRFPARTAFSTE